MTQETSGSTHWGTIAFPKPNWNPAGRRSHVPEEGARRHELSNETKPTAAPIANDHNMNDLLTTEACIRCCHKLPGLFWPAGAPETKEGSNLQNPSHCCKGGACHHKHADALSGRRGFPPFSSSQYSTKPADSPSIDSSLSCVNGCCFKKTPTVCRLARMMQMLELRYEQQASKAIVLPHLV